ncbi:MAG: alpha/beta hydrolase, partial [Proteobacteria bacterium]|nr:alpha/beta hydrolase [Pseudomonadota bacterium]
METRTHFVNNNDGWIMAIKQVYDPDTLVKGRRPVAIIPGWGMNAFIFGYHPSGMSMEEFIVSQGFEVWSVNLRGQGESIREGGSTAYRMADISLKDLPAAM